MTLPTYHHQHLTLATLDSNRSYKFCSYPTESYHDELLREEELSTSSQPRSNSSLKMAPLAFVA